MQTYHLHKGDLVLPIPAQDLTVNVLAFAPVDPFDTSSQSMENNPELSVVISRQIVEVFQQLETIVSQQLDTLARTLQGYQFVQRSPLFLDERDAELVEFTWQSPNGVVYQRQATVICPRTTTQEADVRIALTITATTMETLQTKYEFTFQQILFSLRFHR